MSAKKKVHQEVIEELPKVERCFNDASGISFEDIICSMVQESVEQFVCSSYHHEQVNVATSNEGVA